MASEPSCSRTASALALAASLQMTAPAVADDATPRLGVSPVRDVIQAMTLEEKVALVLGQGMAGMSGGMQGPVVGVDANSRVPGAAGTTFPIERLGIPSIVMADGPTGLRINPTRDGVIEALRAMGADIQILNLRNEDSEPCADLLVRAAPLHGTEIGGALIPRLIDELPVLAAAAAVAEGRTVIRDAAELKVKESNRIRTMAEGLSRLGATVEETEDGLIIDGGALLRGGTVESYLDHRIAMSFAILSLVTDGEVKISDPDCVNISAPTFYEDLRSLRS